MPGFYNFQSNQTSHPPNQNNYFQKKKKRKKESGHFNE